MDEKDIRRKMTEVESDFARFGKERDQAQKRVNDLTTQMVQLQGAHAALEDLLGDLGKAKESLPAGEAKPDAQDTIVAEVVKP